MRAELSSVRVGDLVAAGVLAINDGYRMRNEELGSVGTPFVRGGDIGNGWIDHQTSDHIRPEFAARIATKLTRPWDVAFITKGTVGRVGILKPEQPAVVFAPQVAYWRSLDHDQLHPRFIYYLLSGAEFQARLDADKTHGAMVADYVSLSQQLNFRLSIPAIERQRAIARILGALDDKIDLNRKMNATLEAMARALFKSWFVDFDPVRAKAEGRPPIGMDPETAKLFPNEFIDSEVGRIPKSWRLGNIGDVAANRRDTVHPKDVRSGSVYVGLEHLPRGRVFFEESGTPDDLGSLKARFSEGEVLFGKLRPYFRKVAIAPCSGICSTDIIVLSPRPQSRAFVALLAASDPFIEHAVALSDGTRMPRTSWEQLMRFDLVVSPDIVLQAFERQIISFFRRAEARRQESATLACMRDELLPRLLSGELSVDAAERTVKEVA